MKTINDLSDAILCEIFSYIEIMERQSLEIVCKQWRKVIRHMWSSKTELIFNLEDLDDLEIEVTSNCIELSTGDITHVLAILKICEGNLTHLEINDDIPPPEDAETIIIPLRKNNNLISFKITSEDKGVVGRFLHFLPAASLQELIINFYDPAIEPTTVLIPRINEILKEARALTTLRLTGFHVSPTTLKEIEKLNSLVHLAFGAVRNSPMDNDLSFNTKQLENLESLQIDDEKLVNNHFLTELVKNCRKLRVLTIQSESLTDDSFKIMESLPNMRCVLSG